MKSTFLIAAAGVLISGAASAATFQIDPDHSSAGFKVRHMMISDVSGAFTKVAGTVDYDPASMKVLGINAKIDASSIDTRVEQRNGHLKSPDFLDVAKYPDITFKSTNVEKTGADKYVATGDLTIHGVTKPVKLDVQTTQQVKDPMGNTRIGAHATTKVNRLDYGLVWNKTLDGGGVLVGNDVDITIDTEVMRPSK